MNNAESLRKDILEKVIAYHEAAFANNAPFQPGTSRVPYAGRVFDEEELVGLVDASLDFWLTYGKHSETFEKELAAYLNVKRCFLVNSGSSANLLAFMSLTSPTLGDRQLKRGDEVITVAACFPTTIAPIIQYGAVPVFIDINQHTLNVDASQLEMALSDKTKCVMLAHTLGNPFNLATVQTFCKKHNLWLIEDNCDALGSEYAGQKTGSFGDIGTSSFYPPHHLTMGEGGAVYTNNPTLAKVILSMRDWGRDCWCASGVDNTCKARFSRQYGTLPMGYDHKYVYSHFGYNLKATDMQAAIGVAQLKKLPLFVEKRRENFRYLADALAPHKKYLGFIEPEPEANPSWFGFGLTLTPQAPFTRNALAEFLESKHIQTRNLFSGNITRHPCFETLTPDCDFRIAAPLTQTDWIMEHMLWVGVYPGMTTAHLDYMAQTICEFLTMNGAAG